MESDRKETGRSVPPLVPDSLSQGSSTQLPRLRLDKLDATGPLTIQCRTCERNLKRCILYAKKSAVDMEQIVKDQLGGVEQRLEENRLRLDIWISDCSASEEHYLNNLGRYIGKVVGGAFSIIHEQLSTIAAEIGQLWRAAPKINTERTDDYKDQLIAVEKAIAEVHHACSFLTKQIRVLAEMQTSIQKVQAIKYQIGPYSHLQKQIFDIANRYNSGRNESGVDDGFSGSPTDESGSYITVKENCDYCKRDFDLGALEFHQEFCDIQSTAEDRFRMAPPGLPKIQIARNKNYKASGPKSYVYLLQKWGFEPTKPGPYFWVRKVTQSSLLHKIGGKATTHRVLAKRKHGGTSGDAEASEVTAEDQQNDSEYLCPVEIGTPLQTLNLDFDTGSSDLWVWAISLPSSVKSQSTSHTIFDPTKSTTFKTQKGSTWKISYSDSSFASGTVGTDNVTIGGLTIKNQAIELANQMSDQFAQGARDGLLGLAWGNLNTVTPKPVQTLVENMITQDTIPQTAELFTVNLGSWRDADKGESFYTFGYIDQAIVTASGQEIAYTPIDNSQGVWMFESTSATVNGTTVDQSGNTAIADTGTTLALVADATCEAIYKAIPGATYDSSQQGYVFPSSTTANQLPVVTFAVGDSQFAIQKEDLGFVNAGNGMVYGGIQSRGTLAFDILGRTFLKSIYAIFDQGNVRFGAVQRVESWKLKVV